MMLSWGTLPGMKTVAVKVPPEEKEITWGSSKGWSSAVQCKVSWNLWTFLLGKETSAEGSAESKEWEWKAVQCSNSPDPPASPWWQGNGAWQAYCNPCQGWKTSRDELWWAGLGVRSQVASPSRKPSFEGLGTWVTCLLFPVFRWQAGETQLQTQAVCGSDAALEAVLEW